MDSFDYIAEARAIRDALVDDDLSNWRTSISDAIDTGSVGSEILMGVRWNLAELLKAKPALSAGIVSRIRDYILAANRQLGFGISLSDKWAPILTSQPETGMNYQIATVFLKDGRRFDRVSITGGYIIRVGESADIPFREEDIAKIVVNHGR
jgi:hypothetical protein